MKKLISYIEKNRLGSTEVADALGKKGVFNTNLKPLIPGQFLVGKCQYIATFDESNWPIHEQGVNAKEDYILYVDGINCNDKALFGELVAKYFLLYRGVKGIVVNGRLRDIPHLKRYSFPIFFTGVSPLGVTNKDVKPDEDTLKHIDYNKSVFDDSVLVCDDSGVTLVQNNISEDKLLEKMVFIEAQEDIWSYCINVLKWNTYDTICKKKYLDDLSVLPKHLAEIAKKISF
jgi:regulator of RNase E activity RraA